MNRNDIKILIAVLGLSVGVATGAWAESNDIRPVMVALVPHVIKDQGDVTVGDIVDVNLTDKDWLAANKNVVVLDANQMQSRHIGLSDLAYSFQQKNVDLGNIRIVNSQSSVFIERSQDVHLVPDSQKQLESVLAKSHGFSAIKLDVQSVRILPHVTDPDHVYFKIVAFSRVTPDDTLQFRATIESDDGVSSEHDVFVQAKMNASVYVAKRDLPASHSLDMSDVEFKQVEIKPGLGRVAEFKSGARLQYKLIRSVRTGDILLANDIAEMAVVKQGTLVTLQYVTGALKVSTLGKLVAEAEVGDVVQVQNADSTRLVTGRLVSRDVVEVNRAL